jgi:tRNA G26 N,N-dimethylase Trm1
MQKVKVLDEVSQGGRTFTGPMWTVTETEKVNLVVNQLPLEDKELLGLHKKLAQKLRPLDKVSRRSLHYKENQIARNYFMSTNPLNQLLGLLRLH